MIALQTENLCHQFPGHPRALEDINLTVEKGSIYGFLGPNGAGKTTTLRLVLGLLKQQHGSISVFGKMLQNSRREILAQVGSLIETPSVYGHLTARQNLEVFRKIYRCPKQSIDEALRVTGLGDTGKKHAAKFSLGMRQRLAIATSLLHEPALLILDEPTNGLDPNGIIEIRELLKTINRERGTTILVSSHLLAEVERLVTHVGIISRGRMLFQGTLPELQQRKQQNQGVLLETEDEAAAENVLRTLGIASSRTDGGLLLPALRREEIAKMNKGLVDAGISVFGITMLKNDLESIFMDLVSA